MQFEIGFYSAVSESEQLYVYIYEKRGFAKWYRGNSTFFRYGLDSFKSSATTIITFNEQKEIADLKKTDSISRKWIFFQQQKMERFRFMLDSYRTPYTYLHMCVCVCALHVLVRI